MVATTSCGVLLLSPQRELLLCHATGAAHWDIPKGLGEPGETPRETAVRETFEETCLRVDPHRLLDLGRLAYRPGKDLHLFGKRSSSCVLDGERSGISMMVAAPRRLTAAATVRRVWA
jgi:8-oxo-dGTP pyrophosphatase MutT (NUDIX family)